jgi:hypothetical protein
MKQTLLIISLLITTTGYSQRHIVGVELNSFTLTSQTSSSIEKYPNRNVEADYKQTQNIIAPLFSFQAIKKNNFIYGFELGFSKYKLNSKSTYNDLSNSRKEKRISFASKNMFFLNINCSKKVSFDKFIFIAGIYIPFVFSPISNYKDMDSVFDANTNNILWYQNYNGQNPNYFETGIRFRTELNYPIYKKVYLATKLNFGFDYEHYFGKVNQNSEYFDGTTISNSSREINYRKINFYSKHFSYGVGINYFF